MVYELGVPRVLVAPLCTGNRRLGSVLVYSTDPAAYRGVEEAALAMMAHEAAALIDETQNMRICA
jgi:hypothetical protein